MKKIEVLKKALIEARKSKNKMQSTCLQTLIGSMETKTKGKQSYVLDDPTVIKEIRKAISNNEDAIKEFGSNEEYKNKLQEEIDFLSSPEFLPKMMNEVDIKNIIEELNPKNIPESMKYFNANYNGSVDNKLVNKLTREFLSI